MGTRSVLSFRQSHDEAVQLIVHLDLARQTRIRLCERGEIEQRGLLRSLRSDLLEPARIDIHVTGRASTCAAAISVNTDAAVADCALHYRKPGLQLNLAFGSGVFDIGDLRHLRWFL